MLKPAFSQFFKANPGLLHVAAHSHHPWPDICLAAHQQYAMDSIEQADRKWHHVFGTVLPEVQQHIARELGDVEPERIAFAPNTGEFVARIYSCFDHLRHAARPLRVLTTSSEFHSFGRMTRRLEESGLVEATRIDTAPYETFASRFNAALTDGHAYDLAFLSEVFFDSGFHVDVTDALANAPAQTQLVVDGYHAYMALPLSLGRLADRAFYLAGGYKYAMAGEGACWLYVPPAGDALRPTNTGWFADFGALAGAQTGVPYGAGGYRFFGATFDASGLYRANAVHRWLADRGASSARIHEHSLEMQQQFLAGIRKSNLLQSALGQHQALADTLPRGNFITFALPTAEAASDLENQIKAAHVYIDRRENRLRFGFGVYHDAQAVDELVGRLARAVTSPRQTTH